MRLVAWVYRCWPVGREIHAAEREEHSQPGERAAWPVPVAHNHVKCISGNLPGRPKSAAAVFRLSDQHPTGLFVVAEATVVSGKLLKRLRSVAGLVVAKPSQPPAASACWHIRPQIVIAEPVQQQPVGPAGRIVIETLVPEQR